jgi:tRNA-dihydrouridine synthase
MSFWDDLPQPVVGLSPMDGITDAAFRSITARHGGPDVTFTEFIPVDRIVRGDDRSLIGFRYSEHERPVVAQVFGTDPEAFYRVAHVVCTLGFDGIDINMGCPSKNIAGRGAGAGLIRTPDLARAILRRTRDGISDWASGQPLDRTGLSSAVVEAVRHEKGRWHGLREEGIGDSDRKVIPVSVKTRTGYDRNRVEEWMLQLLSESPAAISLHGRTLTQGYSGLADWEAIGRAAEIVRKSPTLLLGNGDIRSAAMAVRRIRETGVHGVLLGRVTLGNPWIFGLREGIRSAARTGMLPPPDPFVPMEVQLSVALEHAALFDRIRGPRPFRPIRRFLAAYCRGFPGASQLRQQLIKVDTFADVESIVRTAACV